MWKHKSKNPRGKNTYMYMKELKELERKKNCLMDFIIYLWNLKYWFLEPQDLKDPQDLWDFEA